MQITLDLPENLNLTETELRTELAVALFQQERIPLDAASQLAGLHQPDFERLISNRLQEDSDAETQENQDEDVWDVLEACVGTVDAPADWSAEHDHYLYGTPKRHDGTP